MKSVRPLLGTYVVVEINDPDEGIARAATEAAFAAIASVQHLMSAFDPASDVSRINHRAHTEAVRVHPWTAEVLQLAAQIYRDSDGLFDIGIAPRLAGWELLPPASVDIDYTQSSAAHLCLEDDVVRCTAPTRIDLGGIAKGYAVDRATNAALKAGACCVLVNAGGDLRVAGDAEEPIYLRDPRQPAHARLAGVLQDGAIATSGTYYSKRLHEGEEISAIVEPATLSPLLSDASHSVIAPTCAAADALTKVLALSGNPYHPAFARHGAQALVLHAS